MSEPTPNLELCSAALTEWGLDAQIGMVNEEVGELLQAINKYMRRADQGTRVHLMEEIVDVEMMLAQLRMCFDSPVGYGQMLVQKEHRLAERLGLESPVYGGTP